MKPGQFDDKLPLHSLFTKISESHVNRTNCDIAMQFLGPLDLKTQNRSETTLTKSVLIVLAYVGQLLKEAFKSRMDEWESDAVREVSRKEPA
jgi:hypothetical protein